MTLPVGRAWICAGLSALAALILVLRLGLCANRFSPTNDEPADVGAAVSMCEAGKSIAGVSHPPLARWVPAIALYLDGVRLPQCRGRTTIEKEDTAYALGTIALYQSAKPMRTILLHARLLMLMFPLIGLLYVHLLTRHVAGNWQATLAVIFFSLDPTLLGHALWVCDDVAAAVGFLAGVYYLMRWLEKPTPGRAAVAGLAVGLAIAIKFNCALLLPVLAVLILIRRKSLGSISGSLHRDTGLRPVLVVQENQASSSSDETRTGRRPVSQTGVAMLLRHGLIAAVVAFFAIWATYLFNIGPLGDQNVIGHPAAWEHLPSFVRNTPVPMPSFFLGFARQMEHNHLGQGGYLNGQMSPRGWWYYFPEVLVIKSPISSVLAVLASAGIWLFYGPRLDRATQFTLVPAVVYLLISMTGHLDLGVRYALPIIPLLYAFCAIQLFRRTPTRWLLLLLMVGTAVETIGQGPDFIPFFNAAVGGPVGGQRLAADSNVGWGESVYALADWIKSHHATDYAVRLSNSRQLPLLRVAGIDPESMSRDVHGRLLFVDVNAMLIQGRLGWLRQFQPIGRIGSYINVYDLRGVHESPDRPDDPVTADDPAERK
jgi:hypothetical protein